MHPMSSQIVSEVDLETAAKADTRSVTPLD
jgi:hypothetical protein